MTCPECGGELFMHTAGEKAGRGHCNACGVCWPEKFEEAVGETAVVAEATSEAIETLVETVKKTRRARRGTDD